jgi:peptidoglycan/LPS O-acetylase OafA/YrhL
MPPGTGNELDEYRLDINGLRAVAVLAVMVNHFSRPMLPSGNLGVDLFFVISGYVITASLSRDKSTGLKQFLANFYAKRAKRLLPALVACIIPSAILICLFNPWPQADIKTGIGALFGVSNLWLYFQDVNYFGKSAELNVFTQTWSLGVEEQFYFIFPFFVWFSGFTKASRRGARNLALIVVPLLLLSLIAFTFLARTNPAASFFLVTSRFWELAAGCLAYLTLRTWPRLRSSTNNPINSICLIAIIGIFFLNVKSKEIIVLVCLSSYLLVSMNRRDFAHSFLALPVLQWIGKISYSVYLWHWTVIVISRWTIGIQWWTVPLQIGAIFALGSISFRWVESPLRAHNWGKVHPAFLGFIVSAVSSIALSLLALNPAYSLFSGKREGVLKKEQPLLEEYVISGADSSWKGALCAIKNGDDYQKLNIIKENCTLGDFYSAKRRVLVIGNSYSVTFRRAFDRLVKEDNYAVILTSGFGSAPAPNTKLDNGFDGLSSDYWQRVIPPLLASLKQDDIVLNISDLSDFSDPQEPSKSEVRRKILNLNLRKFAEEVKAKELNFVILGPLPFARDAQCDPSIATTQWFHSGATSCTFYTKVRTLERMGPLRDLLAGLESSTQLKVLDLNDIFCPSDRCTYNAKNGQILYRDSVSHPSDEAAVLSAQKIRDVLISF